MSDCNNCHALAILMSLATVVSSHLIACEPTRIEAALPLTRCVLAHIPEGIEFQHWSDGYNRVTVAFSPRGNSVAFIGEKEKKQYCFINDTQGASFDAAYDVVWSPDGSHCAYQALDGKKAFIVLGETIFGWEYAHASSQFFSRDSKLNFVAIAAEGASRYLVIDGKRGADLEWDVDTNPVFSPDGKHLAYLAYNEILPKDTTFISLPIKRKTFVVLDGKKLGHDFDSVEPPMFSPRGVLAYKAHANGREFLVVGETKLPEFDAVYFQVFSPVDNRVAYSAWKDKKLYIMLDDKPISEPLDGGGKPVFSSNGKQIAYLAYIDQKENIVTDGRKLRVIGSLYDIILISNDGQTIVYNGVSPTGRHYVVVDDKKIGDFDFIWNLSFSQDDKHLSFGGKIGNELSWNVIKLHE